MLKTQSRLILIALLFQTPVYGQKIKAGDTFQHFQLPKYGGGTLDTQDYAGKILFINFFGAT